MDEKQKYSTNDVSKITDSKGRIAKALILVANELHNIYSVLWELKEKRKI